MRKAKIILASLLIFSFFFSFSQKDTSHFVKVVFLYGSKPKKKHRDTEVKYFGGIHGGHVSLEVDDIDYGFEPITTKGVHIFPKKRKHAHFVEKKLYGKTLYGKGSKTATFIIPITQKQYADINRVCVCYRDTTPFDYAFFGMRCASTAQDILSKIGITKKKNRFVTVTGTFYPKRLRKRLFKLAKKNNWQVIMTEGRPTRKWERD
jgi:hypothetical protein